MSGEKHIETSGQKAMPDSSIKVTAKNMGQHRMQSNSIPGAKMDEQTPSLDQGVYYNTSCYDYYYPGAAYAGTFGQADDKGYYNAAAGSYTSDNASLLYYLPGYGPYTPEYLQQPYGSEAFQYYSYDSTYSGNGSSGAVTKSGPPFKSAMGASGSGKSNGYVSAKTTNLSNKVSALPYNSKVQHSSNLTKSMYQNPLEKLGSGFQSTNLMKGFHPATKLSSYTRQNPGVFIQYGPVNYQSNSRLWNNNNNYKYKLQESFGKNAEIEALTELTRGPRSDSRSTSPKLAAKEIEQPGLSIERDTYNLQDFKIEYDDAKFFVIKSYSEDDVHKCIKYDVWSSTPNGNKKLDAAYGEAFARTSEKGQKCPVFLFFSVNGSGQFVGVAEMIGQVDFNKNMDFWQLDKWNGYFPIKWHIIKDVPNTLLKHITLENNENRPVTYSRDTQEIGLKQGLEMLAIFKNYSERTSVLDDFNFYENRERTLKSKRAAKPALQSNGFKSSEHEKQKEVGEGTVLEKSAAKTSESTDPSKLISLTQNLSLTS